MENAFELQEKCRKDFESLCAEIVSRISAIDARTPSTSENINVNPPQWWCDMMDLRDMAYKRVPKEPTK